MAVEQAKKRTCTICGTEHKVGEPCPQCNWDQEKEEALAKADLVRKQLREGEQQQRKRGFFNY